MGEALFYPPEINAAAIRRTIISTPWWKPRKHMVDIKLGPKVCPSVGQGTGQLFSSDKIRFELYYKH